MNIFARAAGLATGAVTGTWWIRYAIGAAVLAAALGALGWFGHARYEAGVADADQRWKAQVAQEHERAAQLVTEANARALIAERNAQTRIAAVSTMYEKEIEDANAKHDAVVASLRSGASKLRVAVSPGSCGGRRELPGAPASTSSGDGPATADLRADVAAALESFAHDADNRVRQLTACQQVINAYQTATTPKQ